jgi:ketosteroid isomerase-like protein
MRFSIGLVSMLVTVSACAVRTPNASSWEQDIRAAEQRHVTAFRANDAAAIDAILAEDFLVNSPRYVVLDKSQLMSLVRSGALNAASFDQSIEQIRRYGDIAVVMGADAISFAAPAPNAGRQIRRRFTDIWRFQDNQWRFVARHANPICE